MKIARWIFYFEAIFLNLLTGLIAFVAPDRFVAMFSTQTVPPVPLEIMRWYGVLLFVLAYAMLRALPGGNTQAVAFFVEALLVGDLAHLVASFLFIRAGAVINLPVIIMVTMTAFLACVRTYWLAQYRRGAAAVDLAL